MMKNLIQKLENSGISFWQCALLFYIASFFRGLMEGYANSDNFGRISSFIDILFHYTFFFMGVFLFSFILLRILTGEKIQKISRTGTFFSFIIILPTILDILLGNNGQAKYIFISGNIQELMNSFLTFMGNFEGVIFGATFGMKVEIFLAILFSGYYIFIKTKKIIRALLGAIILYVVIFLSLASPAIIAGIYKTIIPSSQPFSNEFINNFFFENDPVNTATSHRTFVSDQNIFDQMANQKTRMQCSIIASLFFLIPNIILLGWWFYLYDKKKFISVLKNFRFLRVGHYFLMILVGVFIGMKFSGKIPIGSLFDLFSFAAVFLSLLFAWLFSVWENDEIDLEIDKISNTNRPLIKKEISPEEWRNMKYLFLFLSLSFAFLAGYYQFIFILAFLAIYHLYSAPPLRLKRFLGISSFLIALNALLAVFMGFFMSAGTENLRVFPFKYALGIFLIFFLSENVKNLKDVEGDRKNNIKTIPVVFGEENGKLIIGVLVFISALIVPLVFYANIYTFLTAVFFGSLLFIFTNKKKFVEKYIFMIYFIFATVFVLEIIFLK